MSKKDKPFSIIERIRSIAIGFKGIIYFFKSEHNAIVHLAISIAIVILGLCLSITRTEWVMITFAIGFVFCSEIFNTAIEKLADEITRDYSESIKWIKDLSAAAVLISAITAVIIGLIIFIPLILEKII